MTQVAHLIDQYQQQIFIGLGLLALIYAVLLVRANDRLARTPFGLEREVASKRRNNALAVLTLLVLVAVIIALSNSVIIPALSARQATATPKQSPTASPSPVGGSDIVVDSSGCENPDATLTAPADGERIAAGFEVRGTANIANQAFYKYEISGAGTGGAWLSLGVGTDPVVDGVLGSFDASAREPGNYAFRLVVLNSAGNFPPPCVVTVTIVQTSGP
jgi:hypothetical protein